MDLPPSRKAALARHVIPAAAFGECGSGRGPCAIGIAADVRFMAGLDILHTAPRRDKDGSVR